YEVVPIEVVLMIYAVQTEIIHDQFNGLKLILKSRNRNGGTAIAFLLDLESYVNLTRTQAIPANEPEEAQCSEAL
ncbi:MAG: hypothetical protein HN936_09510, partial [Bacteroidetes bacterium]|nr:hypothetical protein [Bacteroidota bacterium]